MNFNPACIEIFSRFIREIPENSSNLYDKPKDPEKLLNKVREVVKRSKSKDKKEIIKDINIKK